MIPSYTLVVPDIHERIEQLHKIDAKWHQDIPRIYLGDWFDGFKRNTEATVKYLAEELKRPDRKFILGNHDFQYLDTRGRCSGYSTVTDQLITDHLPGDWSKRFEVFIRCNGWLLSHAGFNKPPEEWDAEAMKLNVGRSRGGFSSVGGPLWLDWNEEFKGIEGQPQIVGHTHGKHPRIINGSINLDTSLSYVVELKWDGEAIIVAL